MKFFRTWGSVRSYRSVIFPQIFFVIVVDLIDEGMYWSNAMSVQENNYVRCYTFMASLETWPSILIYVSISVSGVPCIYTHMNTKYFYSVTRWVRWEWNSPECTTQPRRGVERKGTRVGFGYFHQVYKCSVFFFFFSLPDFK